MKSLGMSFRSLSNAANSASTLKSTPNVIPSSSGKKTSGQFPSLASVVLNSSRLSKIVPKDEVKRLTLKEKLQELESSQPNVSDRRNGVHSIPPIPTTLSPRRRITLLLKRRKRRKRQKTVKKDEMHKTHQEMLYLFNLRKQSLGIISLDNVEEDKFHRVVIHPHSTILRSWYLLLGVIIFYQVIYIPFVVAFNPDLTGTVWELLDEIFLFLFIMDILVHFNVAYYREIESDPSNANSNKFSIELDPKEKEKLLVQDRWRIAKHYLSRWFWIDLLGAIPYDKLISNEVVNAEALSLFKGFRLPRLLGLLRLLRVLKMLRVKSKFLMWLQYSRASNVFRLMRLVTTIFLIVHLMGCVWNLVRANDEGFMNSDPDTFEKYMKSFYTSLLMVMGEEVGPQSPEEAVFVSVGIIFGAVIMAVIFGNVAILVSNFYSDSTTYRQKIEDVIESMNHLGLPQELQGRIQMYYNYLWEQYHTLDGDTTKFVSDLSTNLQLEVHLYLNAQMIRSVPLIKESNPEVVQKMVLNLKKKIYMPGDNIIIADEIGVEMFFVQRGECEVINFKEQLIGEVHSGGYFGEIALIMSCRRTMNVRARTFCYLCALHAEFFEEILNKYRNRKDKLENFLWSKYQRPRKLHFLTEEESEKIHSRTLRKSEAQTSSRRSLPTNSIKTQSKKTSFYRIAQSLRASSSIREDAGRNRKGSMDDMAEKPRHQMSLDEIEHMMQRRRSRSMLITKEKKQLVDYRKKSGGKKNFLSRGYRKSKTSMNLGVMKDEISKVQKTVGLSKDVDSSSTTTTTTPQVPPKFESFRITENSEVGQSTAMGDVKRTFGSEIGIIRETNTVRPTKLAEIPSNYIVERGTSNGESRVLSTRQTFVGTSRMVVMPTAIEEREISKLSSFEEQILKEVEQPE